MEIEVFNFVSEFSQISKLKGDFQESIDSLPIYCDRVKKLGIFVAHKSDTEIKLRAMEFINFPDPEPWESPYGNLMMSFFYEGAQSILVFFEDYVKARENDIRRTILHEMVHAVCGHECRNVKSPGHFERLPKESADYVRNQLTNFHEDYEVDSFLAERFPEVILEYFYDYSREMTQADIKKIMAKVPLWARRLEVAMLLIEYYRCLLVLEHLPDALHGNRKFKKAANKFALMCKTCRVWLMNIMKKTLPTLDKLISETDFKDQYQLKLWYVKTVELDTKAPKL
jgi:hypothetical protein